MIIFELDGVLRDHDQYKKPVLLLLNYLILFDEDIEIWTDRSESSRYEILECLRRWYFPNSQHPLSLRMRPNNDSTKYALLVERWITELKTSGKEIDMAFLSHESAITAFSNHNITFFISK